MGLSLCARQQGLERVNIGSVSGTLCMFAQ